MLALCHYCRNIAQYMICPSFCQTKHTPYWRSGALPVVVRCQRTSSFFQKKFQSSGVQCHQPQWLRQRAVSLLLQTKGYQLKFECVLILNSFVKIFSPPSPIFQFGSRNFLRCATTFSLPPTHICRRTQSKRASKNSSVPSYAAYHVNTARHVPSING
jgi:hypothetical protein